MRGSGRLWLVLGAAVGVAIALGSVPFLAPAGRSLADTALRLVNSGGDRLVRGTAESGASRRTVLGISAVVAILIPGVTALLAVVAARSTLRVRAIVAVALAILGVVSFFYEPNGIAREVAVLALAMAGLAVVASGPLVAAPLAGLAGLLGATYLPALWRQSQVGGTQAVQAMHQALYARPGDPSWLRLALFVVAALPFAQALRLVLRR